MKLTQDLFLELATDADQLDFPVLYASGREGYRGHRARHGTGKDVSPLFEAIMEKVPPPQIEERPVPDAGLQPGLRHATKARLPSAGSGAARSPRTTSWSCIAADGAQTRYEIAEVLTYLGLKRLEVTEAEAGDIVAVTGYRRGQHRRYHGQPGQPRKPCRASRSASRPWR